VARSKRKTRRSAIEPIAVDLGESVRLVKIGGLWYQLRMLQPRTRDLLGTRTGSTLLDTVARARGVAALLAVVTLTSALSGCQRPPFVVLNIEDPDNAAVGFAVLGVGTERTSLFDTHVDKNTFPLAITISAATAGERTVWVGAKDAEGRLLALGGTLAPFARTGTPTATVQLARACDSDVQCDDAVFCNGQEVCATGVCAAGGAPCAANVDCATTTCQELGSGAGTCTVTVDHTLCGIGRYCNPVSGCVAGTGCIADDNCLDAYQCNGLERCINLVCAGGVPPATDDGVVCTLDGCNETQGVFHVPQSSLDGVTCQLPSGGDGICLAVGGGCVVSVCGDGFVDVHATPAEVCDDGPVNSNSWSLTRHCNATCSGWAPYCGDDVIESSFETCDDGDARDTGNGCSATCQSNDVCGNGIVETLVEQCDDQNTDACDGCANDCQRGCICATNQGCQTSTWCNAGVCEDCSSVGHCGLTCGACAGDKPLCGGATTGCVCNPAPAPRGSCPPGSRCNAGSCTPCNDDQHCGQECAVCSGNTPTCSPTNGVEKGCIASSCTGMPDFTPCNNVTTPDRAYDVCVNGTTCISPGPTTGTANLPGPSFARADLDVNWRYPDTNQRACYDSGFPLGSCPGTAGADTCGATAFCGQDAQYGWDALHPVGARYSRVETVAGEPVVQDNVTGLAWQGCPGGLSGSTCTIGGVFAKTWTDAFIYCDGLTWAGYADWRLPDSIEITTIIDYSRVAAPAVDPSLFPGTPSNKFWSASAYAAVSGWAWSMDFKDGWIYWAAAGANQYYVRCMRPTISAVSSVGRFSRTTDSEPVVTDSKTGLMWQGCAYGQTGATCSTGSPFHGPWQDALANCENLDWGGYTDWYLPNLEEALTILNLRQSNPAIDTSTFPTPAFQVFWTSTSHPSVTAGAWHVEYDLGQWGPAGKTWNYTPRCVRQPP
jgi:cysteine-rich repeat protein